MIKAMRKLLEICDLEGSEAGVGWWKRRDAVISWEKEYTMDISRELRVINPKVFSSEQMDLVKEQLAKELAEELTTYIKYEIFGDRIRATMKAVKYDKN